MSVLRILIDTSKSAATMKNVIRGASNDREMLLGIAKYFEALAGGEENAKVRVNAGGTVGSGTITLSSFVADDYVTINGIALTGKASPSGVVQFKIGTSDEDTSNYLRAAINACTTAKVNGEVYATRRATVACSSVVEDDTLVINGITFTVKDSPTAGDYTQIATGASDTLMGDNIVKAVTEAAKYEAALKDLISISNSSGTLTVNYDGALVMSATGGTMTVASAITVVSSTYGGTLANLCTLAISAHGSVSGAVLTSGADGTLYNYIR